MKRFYTSVLFIVILGSWLNLAPAQNIKFPDANLADKVREALGLPAGAAIPKAELATLTVLNASAPENAAPAEQIHDLTGLEHATQLIELHLGSNAIVDLRPLAALTQLEVLYLWENQINDITPLTGLTQLIEVDLSSNAIIDLRPLAALTQLEVLYLWENQINDITPLTGLINLHGLYLWENQINDITPLTGLTQLIDLFLGSNEISDVSPLIGLVNLESLSLEGNPIMDKAPLHALLRQNPDVEIDIDVNAEVPSTADPAAEWMPDPNYAQSCENTSGSHQEMRSHKKHCKR